MTTTIRLLRTGSGLTAEIQTPSRHMSLRLDESLPAGDAMRKAAQEMRDKAEALLKRATIIEDASLTL